MADEPKILTCRWQSSEGHWSSALEPAQRVDTGRRCQLCSTEIQLSDGQNIFVGDDTYKHLKFLFLNEEKGFIFIKEKNFTHFGGKDNVNKI